ncbi:MAG: hypothetical protein M3O71_17525 [Bacteroidota bacterium]|nr:hypothetical protein [Bacteroidota bacterium]
MFKSIADFKLTKVINKIDWQLLLFLVLFLNVKIAVKIAAVVIIYLLRFNFKFGLSFKNSRLPLFYLLIVLISLMNLFITKGYNNPGYLLVFFMGIGFWLMCLLAIHQVKLSVENNETETIHNTVLAFFVLNAAVSFLNIGAIILETHSLNPYRYQGEFQKYFIGTGDFIKGLTFDTSLTNAALNAMGVIYFLTRKNAAMVLVCMTILLFTGSNYLNLAVVFILVLLFIFKSSQNQKSLIVVCLVLLATFMGKVSPQNNVYVTRTFANLADSASKEPTKITSASICTNVPTLEETRRKIAAHYLDSVRKLPGVIKTKPNPALAHLPQTGMGRVFIDTPNINALYYQSRVDADTSQKVLLKFIDQHRSSLSLSTQKTFVSGLPGKVMSMLQTFNFLKLHPAKLVTGDGMGNFSSKLAYRATSMGFAGSFSPKYAYISNNFLTNHLDLYLNFFSRTLGLHSLINSPYSVYDQVLAEYGLLGLLAFTVYYLGFFTKYTKTLTYGIPVLLLLMMILFTDYWFEQLSVIVLFELLLLLNIKETTKAPIIYGS